MFTATLYMLMIVILGGIFLLNLVTAILWEAFGDEGGDSEEGTDDKDALTDKEAKEDAASAVESTSSAEQAEQAKKKEKDEANLAADISQRLADYRSLESLVKACDKFRHKLHEESQKALLDEEDDNKKRALRQQDSFRRSVTTKQNVDPNSWLPGSPRYHKLRVLVASDRFSFSICGLIILNTVVLACEQYPPPPTDVQQVFEKLNIIFTLVFTIELVIKLLAYTPRSFVADKSNVFDAIVVVLSLVELALSSGSALSGARVWRLFRIMRVFKIARSWVPMRILLEVIMKAVIAVLDFCFVTGLVLFIFTLSGMMFFARTLGDTFEERPRLNFDDPLWAFFSVFSCLTGENWNAIMIDTAWGSQKIFVAITYFLILVFVGNIVLLQLFLAILASSFFTAREEMETLYRERLRHHMMERPDLIKDSPMKSRQTEDDLLAIHDEFKNMKKDDGSSVVDGSGQGGDSPVRKELSPNLDTPGREQGQSGSADDQSNRDVPDTHRTSSAKSASADGHSARDGPETHRTSSGISENPSQRTPGDGGDAETKAGDVELNVNEEDNAFSSPTKTFIDEEAQQKGNTEAGTRSYGLHGGYASSVRMKHKIMEWVQPPHPTEEQIARSMALQSWRRKPFYVVEDHRFEGFITGWILISSLFLAADEGDFVKPDSDYRGFLNGLDIVLSLVFTSEMIMRIIAYGPLAYVKSGWNCMDGIVVCCSWVSLWYRPVRVARTLRPLRLITHHAGMKLVADCLLRAIPLLGNTLIFSMVLWFVLAIMGVSFFKGVMYHCAFPELGIVRDGSGRDYYAAIEELVRSSHLGRNVVTPEECLSIGGVWMNSDSNFDNVFKAMITLFQVSTTEGWTDVLFTAVDGSGINQQPIPNSNLGAVLYFLLAMIVLFFFITNLFVGVILDQYAATKTELEGGSQLMTPEQQAWVSIQKQWLTIEPKQPPSKEAQLKALTGPLLPLRKACLTLILAPPFDTVILACILINVLFMCTKHVGEAAWWTNVLGIVNMIFSIIFNCEMVIKLIALGWKRYVEDKFNIFDFTVVWITNFTMLLESAGVLAGGGSVAPVVRAIRITRVLRLLRNEKARNLRILFFTLLTALPAVCNIAGLLLLLMFIYACLGQSLFGTMAYGPAMHANANFGSFGHAFLLCLRMATGESWHLLMYDCINDRIGCKHDQTWEELQEFGPNGCGNPEAAYLYFISYQLVITWVMFNLFVGAIVDAFVDQQNEDRVESIRMQQIALYQALSERQHDGLHHERFVSVEDTIDILRKVDPPVGFRGVFCGSKEKQEALILAELASGHADLRLYHDPSERVRRLHWTDVVLNSCKRSLTAYQNEDDWIRQKDASGVVLDKRLCHKFVKRFPELTSIFHQQHGKKSKKHIQTTLVPLGMDKKLWTIREHRAAVVIEQWLHQYKLWKTHGASEIIKVTATVKFTIQNVNYSKLTDAGKESLAAGLKSTIAKSSGVNAGRVSVVLSAGSVKVDADVVQETEYGKAHEFTKTMKESLSKPDLSNELLESAKTIPEVVAASDGDMSVTEPVVEAVEPPPPQTEPFAVRMALKAFAGSIREKEVREKEKKTQESSQVRFSGLFGSSESKDSSPKKDAQVSQSASSSSHASPTKGSHVPPLPAPDCKATADVNGVMSDSEFNKAQNTERSGQDSDTVGELRLSEEALRGLEKEKVLKKSENGHSHEGNATTVLGTDGDESQIGPWDSVSQVGAQRPVEAHAQHKDGPTMIGDRLGRVDSERSGSDEDDFTWLNNDEETANLRQMCTNMSTVNMSTVGNKSHISGGGSKVGSKPASRVGTSVVGNKPASSVNPPSKATNSLVVPASKETPRGTSDADSQKPKKIETPRQKKRDNDGGCGDCGGKDKEPDSRSAVSEKHHGSKKSSICGGDSSGDSSASASSKKNL
eukprot:gnl/MRDRNA2_/MRDRNA2_72717_c0_seq1.p1 gnl/MRDRNA2_/MRDRNA2_72717_c0~~gnl/MRDRNA2_/MRDRNA2_72717_c0_seq1.p1  ORF type:complete len:2181 (-),score=416.18 gnl/MRDRNA2_/MRDRNA2_72717_c0_seq1:20-5749(-)